MSNATDSEKDFKEKVKTLAAGPLFFLGFLFAGSIISRLFLKLSPIIDEDLNLTAYFILIFISFAWFIGVKGFLSEPSNHWVLKKWYLAIIVLIGSIIYYLAGFYFTAVYKYHLLIITFPVFVNYAVQNYHEEAKKWFKFFTY